ncbi:MAG: glycerate kinase [Enterocloster clostridioformis]
MTRVADIDASRMHPAVAQAGFTVMCDVTNPLTGPDGAFHLYIWKAEGRYTGNPDVLEGGNGSWYAALLWKEKLGVDVDKIPVSRAPPVD